MTLKNTGEQSVTYNLSSISAITEFAFGTSGGLVGAFDGNPDEGPQVSITLSPNLLELPPGASGNFTAVFELSSEFDPSRVPVYSGYIMVYSSAQADAVQAPTVALQIPYMGVATDVSQLTLFNTTGGFPSLTSLATAPHNTITADDSVVFSMNGTDIPAVNIALVFPSRVVELDVLPGDPNGPSNETNAPVKYSPLNIDLTI